MLVVQPNGLRQIFHIGGYSRNNNSQNPYNPINYSSGAKAAKINPDYILQIEHSSEVMSHKIIDSVL